MFQGQDKFLIELLYNQKEFMYFQYTLERKEWKGSKGRSGQNKSYTEQSNPTTLDLNV